MARAFCYCSRVTGAAQRDPELTAYRKAANGPRAAAIVYAYDNGIVAPR